LQRISTQGLYFDLAQGGTATFGVEVDALLFVLVIQRTTTLRAGLTAGSNNSLRFVGCCASSRLSAAKSISMVYLP
jgi:hypothetical protein